MRKLGAEDHLKISALSGEEVESYRIEVMNLVRGKLIKRPVPYELVVID
jgi:hypothetical protein